VASELEFGTRALFEWDLPIDSGSSRVPLPDDITIGAALLTFGGETSSQSTTSTETNVAAGTQWRFDGNGQPLGIASQFSRFAGFGLTTTNEMDAWSAGVDLLSLASEFVPPLVVVDPFVDVPLALGMEVHDRVSLNTSFLSATYFDSVSGPSTYDHLLLNQLAGPYLPFTIPTQLSPGGTYEMTFTGLDLGFNTFYELLFATDFGLGVDLDLGFCCDPVDILSVDGDEWLVDRFINSYQAFNFLDVWPSITFDVVAGLQDSIPSLPGTNLPEPEADSLLGNQPATARNEFGGNAPAGIDTVVSVPEPPTLLLLASALLGIGLVGRRRFV
jgi:hypothetical protein